MPTCPELISQYNNLLTLLGTKNQEINDLAEDIEQQETTCAASDIWTGTKPDPMSQANVEARIAALNALLYSGSFPMALQPYLMNTIANYYLLRGMLISKTTKIGERDVLQGQVAAKITEMQNQGCTIP